MSEQRTTYATTTPKPEHCDGCNKPFEGYNLVLLWLDGKESLALCLKCAVEVITATLRERGAA